MRNTKKINLLLSLVLCLFYLPYPVQAANEIDVREVVYVNHKGFSKNWFGKELHATETARTRCSGSSCTMLVTPDLIDAAQPQVDGQDYTYGTPMHIFSDYIRITFRCEGVDQAVEKVLYGYDLHIDCARPIHDPNPDNRRVKKTPNSSYLIGPKNWPVTKEKFTLAVSFASYMVLRFLSNLEVAG